MTGTTEAARPERLRTYPYLAFLGVALAVAGVLLAGHYLFDWTTQFNAEQVARGTPRVSEGLFGAWYRGDSNWYMTIVTDGYSYSPGVQSNVAFFPAMPALIWVGRGLTGSSVAAGVLVPLLGGLASAVLFWRWLLDRLDPQTSRLALVLLLVYPYALYLYGPVYSESICLAAVLGSFVLADRGRFVLAGCAGAVAAATRMVGILVLPALVLLVLERRGLFRARDAESRRAALRTIRPTDAFVLLTAGGLVGYWTYLWVEFGDPFVAMKAARAPGWEEGLSVHSLLKIEMFRALVHDPMSYRVQLVIQIALTVVFALFVPKVWKRFGPGYGTYAALIIGVPFMLSHDGFSSGRYLLLAFPVFAVVAEWLGTRPELRRPVLVCSAALLLLNTALYGHSHYVT